MKAEGKERCGIRREIEILRTFTPVQIKEGKGTP